MGASIVAAQERHGRCVEAAHRELAEVARLVGGEREQIMFDLLRYGFVQVINVCGHQRDFIFPFGIPMNCYACA